jgi:hypothetical protein
MEEEIRCSSYFLKLTTPVGWYLILTIVLAREFALKSDTNNEYFT